MRKQIPGVALAGLFTAVACGGSGEAPRSQGVASPAAGAAAGGCEGTVTGAQPGSFTCMAVGNQFAGDEGGEPGQGAIMTVLSNPADPTHRRPEGVKSIGFNVELRGEPAPGTYSMADAGATTIGSVIYAEGTQFDQIRSLTLDLSRAEFQREQSGFGMKSRVYGIGGSLKATLADAEGREVVVEATF